MLLKSIKTKYFRPFIDENKIEFSMDEYKNVTVILGENGSGKTSLAEAFTWCLYGITDFEDSSMLNKIIQEKMLPDEEEEVIVDIELIHDGTEYSISRTQTYKKKLNGKTKSYPTSFHIAKKIKGQQEFLENPELEMKKILPGELSSYFFLNGEHINRLNKELKKGKSQEFRIAVENLLGLKAFLVAIEHLSPSLKHSVIGSYNSQYDVNSNKEILKLRDEIKNTQEEINIINERLPKIEVEIEFGEESCEKWQKLIRENEKSAEYQNKREKLEKGIEIKKKYKENEIAILLKNFNNFGLSFLSNSLIKRVFEYLESEEIKDKGIPEIHERAVDYLIERGYCICGTEIKKGEKAYLNLIETLEFIPPRSIGPSLNTFVIRCNELVNSSETFFETFGNQLSHIKSYETEIEDNISEIEKITEILKSMKDIGVYQSKLSIDKDKVKTLEDENDNLIKKLGAFEENLKRRNSLLTEFALKDEKNKKVEIYKAYSQEIYDCLTSYYKLEEAKVRDLLQNAINEIFRKIYEGGMSISIDEKYRIKVLVDEVQGFSSEIETSTAQSTSVIFAFIAGIIKLAKDFSTTNSIDHDLLAASEPYPLVMDAPLSNFDKRRIKTVCNTLPKIAEQVIIFTKDTDGDIAEKHMGSIIGKRYEFNKISELETIIVAR